MELEEMGNPFHNKETDRKQNLDISDKYINIK